MICKNRWVYKSFVKKVSTRLHTPATDRPATDFRGSRAAPRAPGEPPEELLAHLTAATNSGAQPCNQPQHL